MKQEILEETVYQTFCINGMWPFITQNIYFLVLLSFQLAATRKYIFELRQ